MSAAAAGPLCDPGTVPRLEQELSLCLPCPAAPVPLTRQLRVLRPRSRDFEDKYLGLFKASVRKFPVIILLFFCLPLAPGPPEGKVSAAWGRGRGPGGLRGTQKQGPRPRTPAHTCPCPCPCHKPQAPAPGPAPGRGCLPTPVPTPSPVTGHRHLPLPLALAQPLLLLQPLAPPFPQDTGPLPLQELSGAKAKPESRRQTVGGRRSGWAVPPQPRLPQLPGARSLWLVPGSLLCLPLCPVASALCQDPPSVRTSAAGQPPTQCDLIPPGDPCPMPR